MAHAPDGFIAQRANVGLFGAVGGKPVRIDACCFQRSRRLDQVFGLARAQHHSGAGLAQCVGQLQPQAARTTGDERGFAFEVKQLLNGAGHGKAPCVQSSNFVIEPAAGLA